ncbi:UNVERIFIED_CONTAM: RuBisCO large subunit-binding protein subunit beta, chloroplastic [Sesamum latifolium]|uniref:RuBisCO large subunit-binding protein subunit beta, chloroplastic n=1 Tax=Sesamum latifolium TaxID=2727402 RepID=A0AAW2U4P1_9LAMI
MFTGGGFLSLENLIFFAKTYHGGGFLSSLPRRIRFLILFLLSCYPVWHTGSVIREEIGLTLDKADKEVLGHAAKVVLTKESTTIVGDGSIQEAVNRRVAQIRNLIAAAVEEGIVVGGGCTLLRLASKVGADIVKRAMSYPLKLIAKNAGVNGSVVSEKVCGY